MDPIDLLQSCIPIPPERLGIRYIVTGSVASVTYGEYRNTNGIDVVLRIGVGDADALRACSPEPDFCISPEAVRDAIIRVGPFNVLHSPSGFKIDFMVSSMGEFDQSRFARARPVTLPGGLSLLLASPEDVILKKLEYSGPVVQTSTSATSRKSPAVWRRDRWCMCGTVGRATERERAVGPFQSTRAGSVTR